jgi:hypothetical protein
MAEIAVKTTIVNAILSIETAVGVSQTNKTVGT